MNPERTKINDQSDENSPIIWGDLYIPDNDFEIAEGYYTLNELLTKQRQMIDEALAHLGNRRVAERCLKTARFIADMLEH